LQDLFVMREILPGKLWIGDGGDLLEAGRLERAGIRALIHVALEERLPQLSRELLYCHFPLVDGAPNDAALVDLALQTAAGLIRREIPTLICCSGGMSRTPCIAAGALAIAKEIDPTECLTLIARDQPHDISPALWSLVTELVSTRH
jgi:hypothetical protein